MKKVLIVSLSPNPGHIGIVVSYYRQQAELGNEPYCYVSKEVSVFLPVDIRKFDTQNDDVFKYSFEQTIILSPNMKNYKYVWNNAKCSSIYYVFHEPIESIRDYLNGGHKYSLVLKYWIGDILDRWLIKHIKGVILPSKKSYDIYKSNKNYKNKNILQLPLMYEDSVADWPPRVRKYFSYIGTIASDHSFNEYVDFIYEAIIKQDLIDLNFLIATKSTLPQTDKIQRLRESGRVIIFEGKPFSEEEMNEFYSESICVWNAYARTNQSGVMVKAFMCATPVIILRKNISEMNEDGKDIVTISDNTSYSEIREAILNIKNNFETFSQNCKKRFLTNYFYRIYNDKVKEFMSI